MHPCIPILIFEFYRFSREHDKLRVEPCGSSQKTKTITAVTISVQNPKNPSIVILKTLDIFRNDWVLTQFLVCDLFNGVSIMPPRHRMLLPVGIYRANLRKERRFHQVSFETSYFDTAREFFCCSSQSIKTPQRWGERVHSQLELAR